ncbi:MAG: hypothetical protein GXZ07_10740 [Firmicutes bacterium]|nr:hypothetical protein [Bacillota bacterium]
MTKIKDRIIHGIITGIIAGTPDTIINALEYRAGLTDVSYSQLGANVFLPTERINNKYARTTGLLANYAMLSISGILFTYLLSATGRDKALLKGIGFGILTWLTVYGMGAKVGLKVKPRKPLAPLLSFFDHVIFGSLLGLIAPRIGDDSIFPK